MCKNSARWLYRLERNFSWDSKHPIPEDFIFRDKIGVVRLIIEQGGRITVTRGYAGKPKTYYASLVHDALYQFLPDGLPLGRRHADWFFLLLLAESEFAPRWLYWGAVRLIGGVVWRATRFTRETRGTCQRVAEWLPPEDGHVTRAGAA